MNFLGKIKKLAQKLQMSALLVLLTVIFIFPVSGLMADELDLPVIIPNDELLTPIELRDGLVYEVVVPKTTELATAKNSFSPNSTELSSSTSKFSNLESGNFKTVFCLEEVSAKNFANLSETRKGQTGVGASVFEANPEDSSVKSIASPGLFGFLGICLSRSELPSKNFSMPCENSLQKSMTQRSANDWKFLWQPVRMTSLWRMSTSSSKIQKTLILRPSRNHTHSMSDISSTWSNGMEEFLATYYPGKRKDLVQTEVVLSQPKKQALSQNPKAVAVNQQVL